MQDQFFYDQGAECVAGDLILNRVVVGHYRNGQFVVTPEGAALHTPAEAKEPKATKEPKAARGRTPKAAKEPEVAHDPNADILTGGLDDLLDDLDA